MVDVFTINLWQRFAFGPIDTVMLSGGSDMAGDVCHPALPHVKKPPQPVAQSEPPKLRKTGPGVFRNTWNPNSPTAVENVLNFSRARRDLEYQELLG